MTSEFIVAVHAMLLLSHRNQTMRSEDIAENVCTNPARIRKILSKLKKSGLIETKEGAVGGGYAFTKSDSEITLLQVFDALDDKIISMSWHSGSTDKQCLISSGMAGVMDNLFDTLDDACRNELEKITLANISAQIFKS